MNVNPVSAGGVAVSAAIRAASARSPVVNNAAQIGRQLLEPRMCGSVRLRLIAVEAAGPLVGDDGGDKPDHQRRHEHQHHERDDERDAVLAPRDRVSAVNECMKTLHEILFQSQTIAVDKRQAAQADLRDERVVGELLPCARSGCRDGRQRDIDFANLVRRAGESAHSAGTASEIRVVHPHVDGLLTPSARS